MATLLQCLECGNPVSSHASKCPRCSTQYPFGVKCIVCCEILKRSDALKLVRDYGETSKVRLGKSRTSCPVCKHSIEFDTCSSINCPNCGHHILTRLENPSFAPCCYCGFPLNTRLEVAIKEVPRQFLEGWITETLYAHKICYTSERQEAEKKLQKQDKLDTILANKRQSKTHRIQQATKSRETLAVSLILGLVIGLLLGGVGGGLSHLAFGFASNWKSAALWGFCSVSLLTVVVVWIFSLFD
jgi:DNA-directed RNA polymerase subunit RPC12/RpoP